MKPIRWHGVMLIAAGLGLGAFTLGRFEPGMRVEPVSERAAAGTGQTGSRPERSTPAETASFPGAVEATSLEPSLPALPATTQLSGPATTLTSGPTGGADIINAATGRGNGVQQQTAAAEPVRNVRIYGPGSPAMANNAWQTETKLEAPPRIPTPPSAAPVFRPRTKETRSISDGDQTQRDLALRIQKELRRVGCYSGELHGEWTATSRAAMSRFTERINASLPVETPDQILLALVKGHRGSACGAACPTGQERLETSGKCVPAGLIAAKSKPRQHKRVATLRSSTTMKQPLAGRDTTHTAAMRYAQRQIESRDARAPLPGRMAIGAMVPAASGPATQPPPVVVPIEPGSLSNQPAPRAQPAALTPLRPAAPAVQHRAPPPRQVRHPPPSIRPKMSRPSFRQNWRRRVFSGLSNSAP